MALSIKNPETERLSRELAQRTGETVTTAITIAVQERLDRIDDDGLDREERIQRILKIGHEMAAIIGDRKFDPDDLYDPETPAFARALVEATIRRMSAATLLETYVVMDQIRNPLLARRLDELLANSRIEIVPVSADHARIARAAYRDYGKGSGHPARLNFGDCFSYALAAELREPLLYKGDDFVHTDVRSALPA